MKIWCRYIKCFNDNNHYYFFICQPFIRANPEGVLLEMSALFPFYGSYLTLITSFDVPIIFLCLGQATSSLHSVSYYLKSTHGKKSITLFVFLLSFIASFVVFQHNEEHDFILSNRQFYYIQYFLWWFLLGALDPLHYQLTINQQILSISSLFCMTKCGSLFLQEITRKTRCNIM